MTASPAAINLIELAEGFSPRLYSDQGHPCIGYGCDLTEAEALDYEGRAIDRDEGEALLKARLGPIEDTINNLVRWPLGPLTQNMFDALVDFVYNVGPQAFERSTLLKELNHGSGQCSIADEFLRWDVAGGQISAGLLARRKKEQALFLGETIA